MIKKELFALLGDARRRIVRVVGDLLAVHICNITITALLCLLLHLYIDQTLNAYICAGLVALICIIMLMRRALVIHTTYLRNTIGSKIKGDMRRQVFDCVSHKGLSISEVLSQAELLQLAVEGIEQLDVYFTLYIPQFFFALIAPLILFVVVAPLHVTSALVLLCAVPLIPISIMAVAKWAQRLFDKYWGTYTSMGDSFLDNIQGLKELKIFNADAVQHEAMNTSAERFRKITMKVLVMQLCSTTIMDFVAYGGSALGLGLAVASVLQGELSPVVGLFIVLLAVEFFLPLRTFGSAFHIAMNGITAGKKLCKLFALDEELWGSRDNLSSVRFTLENLAFSYDGNQQTLQDITFSLPEQGFFALVGSSGSGKSTLAKLLLGELIPDRGSLLCSGVSPRTYAKSSYYRALGFVGADSYIFGETLEQLFSWACPGISDEEILAALREVKLEHLAESPSGLQFEVAEQGSNLSGGQRQRLALALQLVAQKPCYIFDEATSNIDAESEAIIMQRIQELSKDALVIVISHHLAHLVSADEIFYLQEGRITEQGTHKELMDRRGMYAHVYTTQKSLEEGYLKGEGITCQN